MTQVALRCGVLVVGRLCGGGAGATWELRALCALFCSEPYNALKVSIFLKRKKNRTILCKVKMDRSSLPLYSLNTVELEMN